MSKTTVRDIFDLLFTWAPAHTAASWDNVGLQLGSLKKEVKTVLLSLDADLEVINLLQKQPFDLVITHHPIFYKPIRNLDYQDEMGKILRAFIQADASLLSLHTNLDAAEGGVNDCLVEAYGFNPKNGLPLSEGFGKWFADSRSLSDLKAVFPCQVLGDSRDRQVKRIGFCAGSGHGLLSAVKKLELDCFITGELTYHDHVSCEMQGIAALTLGHKESEVLILPKIKQTLLAMFPDLNILCLGVSNDI